MPKKVTVRTGVPGETAAERRVLADVSAATAVPTGKAEGILVSRNEYIHLFYKVTDDAGTGITFTVQLWWYSPISGEWHIGEQMNVNSGDVTTIEVQGLNRMYAQVSSVSGTGKLDMWLGLVIPV
jgi:hypothetical protein